MPRPIYLIAQDIRKDWKRYHSSAAYPYLDAMRSLVHATDMYGSESAKGIILYFLSNAQSWRGEVAQRIKAELKELAK
jgi:hypothetical protein